MSKCNSCAMIVVWAWLDGATSRSRAPIDGRRTEWGDVPKEEPGGNLVAEPRTIEGMQVFHVARRDDPPGPRFLVHMASCPYAKKHRKKKAKR